MQQSHRRSPRLCISATTAQDERGESTRHYHTIAEQQVPCLLWCATTAAGRLAAVAAVLATQKLAATPRINKWHQYAHKHTFSSRRVVVPRQGASKH